jgi:hypothetical protein
MRSLSRFRYDPSRGRFRDSLWLLVRRRVHKERARPSQHDFGGSMGEQADEREQDQERTWHAQWVAHHLDAGLESLRASVEPRHLHAFQALFEGRPAEEVQSEFGLSAGALEKVKQRLRARLRSRIRARLGDEGRNS